jgi:hypothetical protein
MLTKIAVKTKEVIQHPIIYTAINAGICHIIQSYVYKHILNRGINGFVAILPGLIVGVYASLSLAEDLPEIRKKTNPKFLRYLKPLWWNLVIILTTALSIAIPYFRQW